MALSLAPRIDALHASAFRVPTDAPEADGTLDWSSTTLIVIELTAGGVRGLGYGYADALAARFAQERLAEVVVGRDPTQVRALSEGMSRAVRNLGRPGLVAMAISAVDVALWDLCAKLHGVPLGVLLGGLATDVPAYGSGGFTSYDDARLRSQLEGWAAEGFRRVKIKVGGDDARDLHRVFTARDAIGEGVELFVDANGAWTTKRALAMAEAFARQDVRWLEEPVSSDDVDGLRFVRERAPAGMDVAAGEYAWDALAIRRLLSAGAVDVIQADATRCGGVTGFLAADALARAFQVPLSAHCAPSLHAALAGASSSLVHVEYFHDHARLEAMLFDGAATVVRGSLRPSRDRPGLGLVLKARDAERFAIAA